MANNEGVGGWGDSFTLSGVEPASGSGIRPILIALGSEQSVARDGAASEGLPAYKDNFVVAGLDGDVEESFRSCVLRGLDKPASPSAIRTAPVGLKIVGGLPPKDHATWDWWRRGAVRV